MIIEKTYDRHKSIRQNCYPAGLSFREFLKISPSRNPQKLFGREARSFSEPVLAEGVRDPWGGYIFRYLIQRASTTALWVSWTIDEAGHEVLARCSLHFGCTLVGYSPLRSFARRHIVVGTRRAGERASEQRVRGDWHNWSGGTHDRQTQYSFFEPCENIPCKWTRQRPLAVSTSRMLISAFIIRERLLNSGYTCNINLYLFPRGRTYFFFLEMHFEIF